MTSHVVKLFKVLMDPGLLFLLKYFLGFIFPN